MFEANLIENLSLSLQNTWWFAALYFTVSVASVFLIPRYNLSKFLQTPKVKYVTNIGKIGYYTLLLMPIVLPFSEFNVLKIIGFVLFFIGIGIYLAGIFYFSISPFDKFADEGIFRVFKHPVYVGFFIILLATAIASGSIIYLILSILYFMNNRILQRAEQQFCTKLYGAEYEKYLNEVKY